MWLAHAPSRGVPSHTVALPATLTRSARRSCVGGTLRALNYMLAISGVIVMTWDFFTYIQWSEERYQAGWIAPTAAPAASRALIPELAPDIELDVTGIHPEVFLSRDDDSLQADGDRAATDALTDSNRQPTNRELQYIKLDEGRYPAFVVVFGIVGALLFVTASVGVLSADLAACGVGVFIFGCYQALMMVLVVLQLAALVFYHTDSLQKRPLSPHSGDNARDSAELSELVSADLTDYSLATFAVLALTLSTLVVSHHTHSAQSATRQQPRQRRQLSVSSGPADSIADPATIHHQDHANFEPLVVDASAHPHCDGLERDESEALPASNYGLDIERSDLQPFLPSSCELDIDTYVCEPVPPTSWDVGSSVLDHPCHSGVLAGNGGTAEQHLMHHQNSDPLE